MRTEQEFSVDNGAASTISQSIRAMMRDLELLFPKPTQEVRLAGEISGVHLALFNLSDMESKPYKSWKECLEDLAQLRIAVINYEDMEPKKMAAKKHLEQELANLEKALPGLVPASYYKEFISLHHQ